MPKLLSIRDLLALTGASLVVACGSVDPSAASPGCGEPMGQDFLPMTVGAEWKYDMFNSVNDLPLDSKNLKVVEKLGDVVKYENTGDTTPGHRWLRHEGSRYVWLRNLYFTSSDFSELDRDQYYDPPALRFDTSRTTPGEEWEEQPYTKSTITIASCPDWSEDLAEENLTRCPPEAISTEEVQETWSVVAVDELLSDVQGRLEPGSAAGGVPAGDFEVTCHQRTCAAGACNSGTYCFARGVGKVFELSMEREELTEFCLPSE